MNKESKIKNIIKIFQETRKCDKYFTLLLLTGFFIPNMIGIIAKYYSKNYIYIIFGISLSLFSVVFIFSQRTKLTIFTKLEGKLGATSFILSTLNNRNWIVDEKPISINARTSDLLFRIIGRSGIILVGEGSLKGTQSLFQSERKKIIRIFPNVLVHFIQIGNSRNTVKLINLIKYIKKLKKNISKNEMYSINTKLTSLASNIPIPKGFDPINMRLNRK